MPKFIWAVDGESQAIVEAQDYEEAVRKAIALRMRIGQTAEEAVGWFNKGDIVLSIDVSTEDVEPYQGDIEDQD